jgi:O-antigen/teichoic acid export membrane protein
MTLASGSGIAQIIPLLFYPVLSRLFTESDYAVFGLYISIFEFLAIVMAGRYELTIVLPEKDKDAKSLVAGSIIISTCLSLIVLGIVLFFNQEIGRMLNNAGLSPYLFFLPVILFIYAVNRILTHWLIRKEAFRSISVNKVFHKSSDTLVSTMLGFFKVSSGLIIGDLAGRFILLVLNVRSSFRKSLDFSGVSKKSILSSLGNYINFPVYNTVPALANSLANILPVFLISAYYTETISGNFNFSKIILAAPIALISTSISQVLSQKLSDKKNKSETIWPLVKKIVLLLSAGAAVMVLMLVLAGPEIFSWVFGEKWELAGQMSSILIIGFGIQFVFVSLYPVFYVFNAIKIGSFWQLMYSMMIASLFFLGDYDVFTFIRIYVLLVSVAFSFYALLIYFVIRKYEGSLK